MSLKIYWERINEKQSIKAKDYLNRIFASINKPDIIGRFEITSLSLGSKPPSFEIISIADPDPNIVTPIRPSNSIEARVRFSYDGDAHFMLEAELLVNAPTPKFIIFPISIKVSSPHISGIASVIYDEENVCFCLLPSGNIEDDQKGPIKDLKVEAQLGDASQHVLNDLDKLINFVTDELREIIRQRLVYPNRINIPIKDNTMV
ncbi:hypothetical protein SAMD00019534_120080 [Acytostelium subglobosum LB1]|uniref:hypothetical protein n=1 Tax=Acytostelium subglobosum LB1 TaxID=1410327 RepID=UPI0006451E29|nr:hypothetical protein SAMD00019534_120080 [Acytostelium subglobosum LB1]GAM28832.1 hypothetical protein SAMD00019534_120080 [Acytostelium subglobosum LB1]|eukprot:XP_012748204.1 hypothetical protein SAMD00019534_120080 [Acytostelium subglobosum LB1]